MQPFLTTQSCAYFPTICEGIARVAYAPTGTGRVVDQDAGNQIED